jgi:hypothetical protein
MSQKTEISDIKLWNSITIHASLDMQAALRPSKWYCKIIGGHRCLDTVRATLIVLMNNSSLNI